MAKPSEDAYKPPFWLPGGHLQTIFPALFRKVDGVVYRRERLTTWDGDFLLLDWCLNSKPGEKPPLVILSHGLEGDSYRPYILGMVRHLRRLGFDCLVWNFRSCGGKMNQTARFYHSGATDDLNEVVSHAARIGHQNISLIGFSLGGNLTLKYLGEDWPLVTQIRKAVCFCVPFDLEACSIELSKPKNKLYQIRFLRSLKNKIREKSRHLDGFDLTRLNEVGSVYQFDEIYTGPLHGFKNAKDYYTRCSAKRFVESVRTPTLVINSANDPMIPVSSLPVTEVQGNENFELRITRAGGHCGFPGKIHRSEIYWSESEASRFLSI